MIKENSKFHLFNELKIRSENNKSKFMLYDTNSFGDYLAQQ